MATSTARTHNDTVVTHNDQDRAIDHHDDIVFVTCHDVSAEVFVRFYCDVLEPAFPAEELNDLETVRAAYLQKAPDFHGTIALRGGEPVGGALGEYHAASRIMLLAYVAVRSDMRGRGLGSALLKATLPRWRTLVEPIAVLAEIEHPAFHKASAYGNPEARLKFYDKLASRMLPLPYFQPSLGPGLARVYGMLLICLDPDLDTISGDVLQRFLDDYITSCEGACAREEDAKYRSLRDRAGEWPNNEIPLWPLSRAAEIFAVETMDNPNRERSR